MSWILILVLIVMAFIVFAALKGKQSCPLVIAPYALRFSARGAK